MLLKTLPLAIAVAAGSISPQARAVTNGSFESGLAGWETAGDVAVRSDWLPAAPHGAWQAVLSTASAEYEDDYPLAAGALNLSGTSAAPVGSAGGLETFVGLPLGGLDPDIANGIAAYEGSAIRQSFAVQAGDVLSFSWAFQSADPLGADYAFLVIDGALTPLMTRGEAGAYTTFSHTFSGAGTATLAFGVADVGDYNGTSTLAVDNLQVTPVPEPQGGTLLLAGLAVVGGIARRRLGRA